jgi:hypothetical protein
MQRATLIMKINATVMMVCVRRCAVVCKVHMNMTGDGCCLEYIEGMVVNQRHNACDLGHDEQTQEPAPKAAGVLADAHPVLSDPPQCGRVLPTI